MAYILNKITIRTDNSENGIKKIEELWNDITKGKLPLLFDSCGVFQQGISPVSCYNNYAGNELGEYDLSIMAVDKSFFEEMDKKVSQKLYKKYDESDESGNIDICTKKAWQKVWEESAKNIINRSFSEDFESSVPAEYTKDNKAHCYLYIAIK